MEHDHLEDGDGVCMGTPEHELNEYHYDATDARQADSATGKWKKIDKNGTTFSDGPGPWKQV